VSVTSGHAEVPMLDLRSEVDELWSDLSDAVARVLRSGRFILGDEVAAFEAEVADYLGVAHAVTVNSGTDALIIGLRAAGVGPGDEVITTPFTFFATIEAIHHVGATPVFVDIAADGFNIDPDAVDAAVTERSRAVLPVHLFGDPAPLAAILAVARRHDLRVIEDCAQAFGAGADAAASAPRASSGGQPDRPLTGGLGDAGAFSFYPTKNLGAYGDGGMVTSNDAEVAARAVSLRNHAATNGERYRHTDVGYNSRLDELQAAILRVKLPHVATWNRQRREVARRYDALLGGLERVTLPPRTPGHVYHQYTIRVPAASRSDVRTRLADEGIASSMFYPPWSGAWPDFLARLPGRCPRAERAATEVLSLPIHPRLTEAQQERVAAVLAESLA